MEKTDQKPAPERKQYPLSPDEQSRVKAAIEGVPQAKLAIREAAKAFQEARINAEVEFRILLRSAGMTKGKLSDDLTMLTEE